MDRFQSSRSSSLPTRILRVVYHLQLLLARPGSTREFSRQIHKSSEGTPRQRCFLARRDSCLCGGAQRRADLVLSPNFQAEKKLGPSPKLATRSSSQEECIYNSLYRQPSRYFVHSPAQAQRCPNEDRRYLCDWRILCSSLSPIPSGPWPGAADGGRHEGVGGAAANEKRRTGGKPTKNE